MSKLNLQNVTLFALSTRGDINRTSLAIKHCVNQIDFADVVHVAPFESHELRRQQDEKRLVIKELDESEYALFMINKLCDYIDTDFVLTVQWDGFVINQDRWKNKFLEYDYIGAPWEFSGSKNNVGNGGFSLRSKKLLELCKEIEYSSECDWFTPLQAKHRPIPPEDWYICYHSYEKLIRHGIKFPSVGIARSFSVENSHMNTNFYNPNKIESYRSFGFHGANNTAAMEILNAK